MNRRRFSNSKLSSPCGRMGPSARNSKLILPDARFTRQGRRRIGRVYSWWGTIDKGENPSPPAPLPWKGRGESKIKGGDLGDTPKTPSGTSPLHPLPSVRPRQGSAPAPLGE